MCHSLVDVVWCEWYVFEILFFRLTKLIVSAFAQKKYCMHHTSTEVDNKNFGTFIHVWAETYNAVPTGREHKRKFSRWRITINAAAVHTFSWERKNKKKKSLSLYCQFLIMYLDYILYIRVSLSIHLYEQMCVNVYGLVYIIGI